ncbi:hypothetical protein E2C01_068301 [Portunus trituberculatus]|uniref:Integrase zinc-binding domain-containing protein n=1 Tax=Portunus trituberculatus TaxID=210409 RepID=A0A5B7HZ21_PORTR|nr:hypothetical protein [Portunus trituberculatus]
MWIENNNCKIPYVQNRVQEIKEKGKTFKYMKVETKENPADLLSRGVSVKHLQTSSWFRGPDWLKEKSQWPEQRCPAPQDNAPSGIVQLEATIPVNNQIINVKRYSSLEKLLAVTRRVFNFISNLFARRRKISCNEGVSPIQYWIKLVQSEVYDDEISVLSSYNPNTTELSKRTLSNNTELSTKTLDNNTELSTKTRGNNTELSTKTLETQRSEKSKRAFRQNKLINQLGLYLDEVGILRCRGRLHNSSHSYGSKHPVLLPKSHWLSHLVVMNAHHNTLHGGMGDTLTNIRTSFWIPKARQAVKSCIKSCVICRHYEARTVLYPGPPPLPEERVQESRPFQVVGVDYSGAIHLQDPDGKGESVPMKIYVCLFTCAMTRAVHLELATDMTANTFLKIFRRFAARRSCPSIIISDKWF